LTKKTPELSCLKTLTITLQAAQETLQGSPTALPTSEPGAGNEQISYTVGSGDLPTFSIQPSAKKWVAIVFGSGKFVTAGTLYYRMKKNGSSVATSSSAVAANTFYTRMFCHLPDRKRHQNKIARKPQSAIMATHAPRSRSLSRRMALGTRRTSARANPLFPVAAPPAMSTRHGVSIPAVRSTPGRRPPAASRNGRRMAQRGSACQAKRSDGPTPGWQ